MSKPPDFNLHSAHRYFAADCFNRAWDLIKKPDRSTEEDEQMLRLSLASHYHWTQRDDYTPTTRSIGHWQTSRIYALLEQGEAARRYGELCLQASQESGVEPFFLGYAYEALARAEAVLGNRDKMQGYLQAARRQAELVSEADEQKALLEDLDTIT
jgi:hypothetical protein